jgi:ribosome maturation factor RimP
MDLEGLVRPLIEAAGLEFVEVAFLREGGRTVLRVTVDRDGGVDLDSIALASERLARRLDLEGFAPGPYALEVSSPGLERPLREPRDFAKRVGQQVKVKTSGTVDGARTLIGTIVTAGPDEVRIATEAGEHGVSYDDIASARTVVDWEQELKAKAKDGTR